MIVGRNNSGKTSVVEIFRKLVRTDTSPFSFDDISLNVHKKFAAALKAYDDRLVALSAGDQHAADGFEVDMRKLPEIELSLTITYEDEDDLAAIAPLILDLDPTRFDATLQFRTFVKDPIALFQAFHEANDKKGTDLFAFLRKNFSKHTTSLIEAVDAQDPTNRRVLTDAELRRLVSIKFIYAQNLVDDMASDSGHGLSRGFEEFYRSNQADNDTAERIADLLEGAGLELDEKYQDLFKAIYTDLEVFGVGRMPGLPKLSVISEFEAVRVLRGNAHLYYNDAGVTQQLPEAYNGLGYSKLIFTILQFIGFYEELKRSKPRPPIQLIFVEEPEAHLHPQMQYVFVKSIRQFVASKADWNAQTIITTHSSHMVAESGFDCIRYFDNSVTPMDVRDLSQFRAEQVATAAGKAAFDFLEKYMVLNRCDMFFADKLILIEGAVERLLLPRMINDVAKELAHQYLSVIEVGGAYAHLFRGIVEFLNVQTLIITDIDSVDPADKRKAKAVAPGLISSNQSLVKWLPAKSSIDELLAVPLESKSVGRVAVAYQVPELTNAKAGRSFEESFILANSSILATEPEFASETAFQASDGTRLDAAAIEADSFERAKAIDKKTDFAFDILQMSDWAVPRYIKEGLEWLSKTH